ncbi:MAG: SDR family oxidoreductase [Ignavibacteria bacterium]|nr:SDR family oxidoreductase [Ignavibacteria bacterium]
MKTALITGASTGIGREFSKLFARDGYNLLLVARNETALASLASDLTAKHGIAATIITKDLSSRSSPTEIYDFIHDQAITIDVLVNNAGFGTHGAFTGTDLILELQQMDLNIVALTHLTKLFVKDMVRRGSGRILNVASTAAFQPGPLMAVYYATKAYVLSFSEALRAELKGTGITVTTLCPGPTRTEFQKRAGMEKTNLFRSANVMEAATVAAIGYRGLMNGKGIVVPGIINKLVAFGVRLSPREIVTGVVKRLNQEAESG